MAEQVLFDPTISLESDTQTAEIMRQPTWGQSPSEASPASAADIAASNARVAAAQKRPYGQKPDGTFYKPNELWPSDQPQGSNWLDVLLGVAKSAPGGIKTYYDIQAQQAALKATRPAKAPRVSLPSMTPPKTNWVPWVVGGIAILAIGGGAFALSRRKSTVTPTPKKRK